MLVLTLHADSISVNFILNVPDIPDKVTGYLITCGTLSCSVRPIYIFVRLSFLKVNFYNLANTRPEESVTSIEISRAR